MIDYLKILCKDSEYSKRLFKNPLLIMYSKNEKFKNKLIIENEFIKQATYIKSYKEILFCFFTKNEFFTKLEILVKPHYYFNENLHNANDFKAVNCINILTEIKDVFNLPITDLSIINIEFGVNFRSSIDIKDLISYAIYQERNQFINSSDNLSFSKISSNSNPKGEENNYKRVKFYAKGVQFPQYTNINTGRLEIKSKESKYINKLDIYTCQDLLKKSTYLKLAEVLKEEFKKILILDIDNKGQNLSSKELSKLNNYKQTTTWIKYIQGSRNLFSRHKKDYFKILDKTENNIHQKTYSVINIKLNELIKGCADSNYIY